jgi:2-oxoglutarate dehydrogenase E1 component
VDGCEALIPGLKALLDRASDLGVEHMVMGMPHRGAAHSNDFLLTILITGRLNMLANVLRKPLESIFHEFETSKTGVSAKIMKQENSEGLYIGSGLYTVNVDECDVNATCSGDVKYHLGTSRDRTTRSGKKIHISLLANPSHLEAVDPVAEGKARARQYFLKDEERNKVCSVLLHGDAAFAAQGVVYETLDLSGLPNYTTGMHSNRCHGDE